MKIKEIYYVQNLDCGSCASKIENRLNSLPYVNSASLNFINKKLIITLNEKKENLLDELNKIIDNTEPGVFLKGKIETLSTKTSAKNNKKLIKNEFFIVVALLLMFIGLFGVKSYNLKLIVFLISYLLAGLDVIIKSTKNIFRGNIFDENFLMTIATLGALSIGYYSEAITVMIFYKIGEYFQERAVNSSKKSIEKLLKIKPHFATIKINNVLKKVEPEDINIGDTVVIKTGEQIPLDGIILDGEATVDVSAITGESIPIDVMKGSKVISGCNNINGVIEVRVEKDFYHSTVNQILELVENAGNSKAETEKFITKFAKYYTPTVVLIAAMMIFVPFFTDGDFKAWLYRALIFLVISCPCALVLSIPLGFFSGIGLASRKGILIKGGNFLEALNSVSAVIFDKTGTITKGNFQITQIYTNGISKEELLYFAAYGESYSNHPIAKTIVKKYNKKIDIKKISDYQTIHGLGISVKINNKKVLLGNHKLMQQNNIVCKESDYIGTIVYIAIENTFKGYIVISDEIKTNSKESIAKLQKLNIKIYMLTGDNNQVAHDVGNKVNIKNVYGNLLPNQKVEKFEEIKNRSTGNVIFIGDGINDAPVLTSAHIGVAMGGIGSDIAIEAADIVIMNDDLSKVYESIKIANLTKKIITQNIILVIGIKLVVMTFGILGLATMWEAIFSDVGVSILVILNSIRILKNGKI